MRYLRSARLGLAAVIIAALLAACSSEEAPSASQQAQPEQQEQQLQPEPQPQAAEPQQQQQQESAEQSEQQAQTEREEQSGAATQSRGSDQASTSASAGQDQQEQEQADEPAPQPSQAQQEQQEQQTATVSNTDDDRQTAQESDEAQPSADDADESDQGGGDDSQQTQPQQPAEQSQQQVEPEEPQAEQPQAEQQQEQPAAEQSNAAAERERLELRAEEIAAQATVTDLVGLNGWLNGEETTIALELAKGNVVLVDFWTYTCINCVRTLPFLTAWDAKYREHGLVILGVHTPEFEFEKDPDNIRGAIAEYGIEYDVPMDNDYRTWRAFSNRYWPAKYLIGPTDDSPMGVRYFHFGEGHYEETEEQIRLALEAAGHDLSDVPVGVDVAVPNRSDVGRGVQTRELYGGWRRNTGGGGPYAGQEQYFLAGLGAEYLYRDVDRKDREHNRWYLEGLWRAESQAIAHARTTDNLEDYMALIIRARTVNVVLTVAEDGRPYDVFVQYNDDWVQPEFAGAHIQWDGEGRSFVRVNENDLFRLLFFEDFTEGELKLSSNSDQFRIFAFTFGSYMGGE